MPYIKQTPKEELVLNKCWKPDCRNIAIGKDGSGWEWCAEHEDQENTGSVLHTFQERYDYDYYLNKVNTLLQTEQTRIAEEVEKIDNRYPPNSEREILAQKQIKEQILSIIKQGK